MSVKVGMPALGRLGSMLALACVLGTGLVGCGSVVDINLDASVGTANGDPCTASAECGSGHCADSVCCDTACTGICEACNVSGSKGTCSPAAAGTDPHAQCGPIPIVTPDAGTDDAGTDDGGFHLPDGGFTTVAADCAGSCNGMGACAFPDKTKKCGDSFCNTDTEVAVQVCDGEGHCGLEADKCAGYECGPNACKTTCTANSDCDADHYCNAGKCDGKLATGTGCSNLTQCKTGFCDDGVCCNTDCSKILGGKCDESGSAGQCQCVVGTMSCADCKAYYPDADGDLFGDHLGTPVAGCGDVAPIPGYVANNTDCYDRNANAYPGSTYYGTTELGPLNDADPNAHGYDYNCDGVQTGEYVVRVGASCGFCGSPYISNGAETCDPPVHQACSATYDSKSRYLACTLASSFIIIGNQPSYNCTGFNGFFTLCNTPPCYTYDQVGFTTAVSCGEFGTYTECGSCSNTGTVQTADVSQSRQQACN